MILGSGPGIKSTHRIIAGQQLLRIIAVQRLHYHTGCIQLFSHLVDSLGRRRHAKLFQRHILRRLCDFFLCLCIIVNLEIVNHSIAKLPGTPICLADLKYAAFSKDIRQPILTGCFRNLSLVDVDCTLVRIQDYIHMLPPLNRTGCIRLPLVRRSSVQKSFQLKACGLINHAYVRFRSSLRVAVWRCIEHPVCAASPHIAVIGNRHLTKAGQQRVPFLVRHIHPAVHPVQIQRIIICFSLCTVFSDTGILGYCSGSAEAFFHGIKAKVCQKFLCDFFRPLNLTCCKGSVVNFKIVDLAIGKLAIIPVCLTDLEDTAFLPDNIR